MILIKLATRGRKDWFKRAFENIFETTEGDEFKVLISADLDDVEMNNDEVKNMVAKKDNALLILGNSQSKIHAINRDMECAGWWDILVNFSDDMLFTQKGWNKILEKRMKEAFPYGDCFMHFPDGFVNELLPTMSIMDRRYYNRTHSIYHWEYKSFSCDADAMYVAQMLGRYKYFPDQFFVHLHNTHIGMKSDVTYSNNSMATDHDLKVYWKRLNNYFYTTKSITGKVTFEEHIGKNKHLYE